MQPALRLFSTPRPPARPFAFISLTRFLRAVPITYTFIPLVKQCVPWNVVLRDVLVDLREIPGEEGVEFDKTCRIDFERL